jgi:hypothetical protein
MKQLIFTFLSILITSYAFAQGVSKNGKITSTGTEYVNKNGGIGAITGVDKNGKIVTAVVVLALGDTHQGGRIFYFFAPGDPGYIAGETHGLIATTTDQGGGITWGNNLATGVMGDGVGAGKNNTALIVANQGAGSYAAQLCNDLVLNGYDDWYLPSKWEIHQLFLRKGYVGGFSNNYYWSSTEVSATSAWAQYLVNDFTYEFPKNRTADKIRAIRTF